LGESGGLFIYRVKAHHPDTGSRVAVRADELSLIAWPVETIASPPKMVTKCARTRAG
jgi:hypothetical protein